MKTMMELLIRLQQLRDCCQRTANNQQLTDGEKNRMRFFKFLVRDCLPMEVLARYDRLMETELQLRKSPEVLAMAVLVDTWRDLVPAQRRRLEGYFATPARGRRKNMRAAGRLALSGQFSARNTTMRVRSCGKTLPS